MGSQNLYPAALSEFGLVVDSKDVTREFIKRKWAPLYEGSIETKMGDCEKVVGEIFTEMAANPDS